MTDGLSKFVYAEVAVGLVGGVATRYLFMLSVVCANTRSVFVKVVMPSTSKAKHKTSAVRRRTGVRCRCSQSGLPVG